MSARGIIGGLAGMAASAVKHPKSTTEQALLAAKEMATTGTIVADKLIKKGLGKDGQPVGTGAARTAPAPVRENAAKATVTAAESVEKAAGKVERTAEKVAGKAEQAKEESAEASAQQAPAKKAATKAAPKPTSPAAKKAAAATKPAAKKSPAKKAPAKKAPAKRAPKKDDHDVVLAVDFPAPPEEPPVDVVGQALAKEAEQERQSGPTGSVLPPVRDKDEAVADPATLKAVRAEAEMMTKAASPRKS